MLKSALILLFVFQCAHAVDIEKEIVRLNDEEFSVREEATAELSKLPLNFVRVILHRAEAYKNNNAEVWTRLRQIAKNIFCIDLLDDERYLRLHGGFPFDAERRFVSEAEHEKIRKLYPNNECVQRCTFRVNKVDPNAHAAGLRINDVILLVTAMKHPSLMKKKMLRMGTLYVAGHTSLQLCGLLTHKILLISANRILSSMSLRSPILIPATKLLIWA